ncbi:MAG TPA: HD domain-containing phosphohydrolase [bacterium]|nr:HD domain-containing phosphohydrolase [bacterium]
MNPEPAAQQGLGTILLVDDEPHILTALKRILRRDPYRVLTAGNAQEAMGLLETEPVNVLVLDYWMPEVDGLMIAREAKDRFPGAIRIMLTGCIEMEVLQDAVRRGEIYRYLVKPWDEEELSRAIMSALELSRSMSETAGKIMAGGAPGRMEKARRELAGRVYPRAGTAPEWAANMLALAHAVDARDPGTLGHSSRVAVMSMWLAPTAGLDPQNAGDLELGALLHDVGKVSVPDAILFKPGSLAQEEYFSIQQHPALGEKMLAEHGAPEAVQKIARHHHENYDGSGYPDGLSGERIPLTARIVRLADSFDAMFHRRPYRNGLALDQISREIKKFSGRQFDPALADMFLAVVEDKKEEILAALGQAP